ncbi:hypothetical protein BDZ89DRAFT_1054050, partial [Hymenopellis radicata]
MLNLSLTDNQRTLLDGVYRYDACCLLESGLDWTLADSLDSTSTAVEGRPLILLPSLSVQAADYIRASLRSTSITATFILIAMASLNDYAVNWDLGLNIILSGHVLTVVFNLVLSSNACLHPRWCLYCAVECDLVFAVVCFSSTPS